MAYENYGTGVYGIRYNAGAPVAGTNEVQTATFGGTWLAGDTFVLSLDGRRTAAIPWSATNATLLASVQTALNAISGTNWIVPTAGTLAAGLGTMLLTFSGGDYARRAVNTITVPTITSAAGTLTVAETTPGVTQTGRDIVPGAMLLDTTNNKLYINTGSAGSPTWTVVGTQV